MPSFQLSGPLQGDEYNRGLGGISWLFCPTTLGMFILKSGRDFSDRPLNVLLLD